jgi:magnesium transporter
MVATGQAEDLRIEILDCEKNLRRLNSVAEIPSDLSGICSIQITNYQSSDVPLFAKTLDIDTTILNNSEDIEISSHYLEQKSQLSFNLSLPYLTTQNRIDEASVCYVLKGDIIFAFMSIDFDQFIPESQRQKHFENIKKLPLSIGEFLNIMVAVFSDYFADLTEVIAKNVKSVYSKLQNQRDFSEPELNEVTKLKFNNLIIKESLNEFRRVLHLLRKNKELSAELKETLLLELNDLAVINEYIQNNFERLDDLKDYVSTKIDLEQNRIFKTLTIITMCISSPMLVAGFYGMNFKYMPEIEWKYGYIYGIFLLVVSFLIPLLWFKRKKWL